MITRTDIQDAAQRIATHVRHTPVIELEKDAFGINAKIFFKLECLQHAGSFKPRGAFNCILSSQIPEAGVIAASGGNHGAAVAYAAQKLGHHAEIFVPNPTPANKINRLRQYGATINLAGKNYSEALAASCERAAQTGALPIHAYDDNRVLAGQGTLAMEFEEQAGGLDSVLIAVGGGGLIGGAAAWFQGKTRIISVEPECAPTLHNSLIAGHVVDVETSGVASDSLGARRAGELMFPLAQKFIAQSVLVTDDQIVNAQKVLWQSLRLIAEPGGTTAFAALLAGVYKPSAGERVGVVLCGSNAELAKFPA
jgi:threonine dehydratase